MYSPYPGYPGYPTDDGASFGAEGDPAPENVSLSPAPMANAWTLAKLWTPD